MAKQDEGKGRFIREVEWIPKTNLGKLVKCGKITSLEQIFASSLRIQEPEIVDHLLGKANLSEELLSVKSVQRVTKAGQRTSMKVVIIVGNRNGYIGIGTHSSRELSTAIRSAATKAKMNIMPVRMGQWEGVSGTKHTLSVKSSGSCGSVTVKLVPAPVGTGIEYSRIHKRIFELAGLKDIFVKSYGTTKTTENLAKAIIYALEKSSNFFIPDEWDNNDKIINPLVEHAEIIAQLNEQRIN